MTTWAELVAEAEHTIELRRDVEYAGGQGLAHMILDMNEDSLKRIADALESVLGVSMDGQKFIRVVVGGPPS